MEVPACTRQASVGNDRGAPWAGDLGIIHEGDRPSARRAPWPHEMLGQAHAGLPSVLIPGSSGLAQTPCGVEAGSRALVARAQTPRRPPARSRPLRYECKSLAERISPCSALFAPDKTRPGRDWGRGRALGERESLGYCMATAAGLAVSATLGVLGGTSGMISCTCASVMPRFLRSRL
jgi:hypothetical protein